MLRITIEDVPEPHAVPRGPCRRETDMLYPTAMMEPKLIYQQGWFEGETKPDITRLIGLLNGLDVPLVCANCGHSKEEHTGGIGVCDTHNYQYGSQSRCGCKQYMTAQQCWNQATLEANKGLVKQNEDLVSQGNKLIARVQVQTKDLERATKRIGKFVQKEIVKSFEDTKLRGRERQT